MTFPFHLFLLLRFSSGFRAGEKKQRLSALSDAFCSIIVDIKLQYHTFTYFALINRHLKLSGKLVHCNARLVIVVKNLIRSIKLLIVVTFTAIAMTMRLLLRVGRHKTYNITYITQYKYSSHLRYVRFLQLCEGDETQDTTLTLSQGPSTTNLNEPRVRVMYDLGLFTWNFVALTSYRTSL
jgi:hypothetical protein